MITKAQQKYAKSPKGIANRKRYEGSAKSKACYSRYRAKPEYKIYSRNRYKTMPENKKKARYYVQNAVRDGRLKRPKNCEKCGIKDWGKGRTMIEAHHYKGYDQKFWLAVQWLCTNCHKEVMSYA